MTHCSHSVLCFFPEIHIKLFFPGPHSLPDDQYNEYNDYSEKATKYKETNWKGNFSTVSHFLDRKKGNSLYEVSF